MATSVYTILKDLIICGSVLARMKIGDSSIPWDIKKVILFAEIGQAKIFFVNHLPAWSNAYQKKQEYTKKQKKLNKKIEYL